MRPRHRHVGGALEGRLIAWTIHLNQDHGAGACRQFLQPPRDRGQRGIVADQQVPVEIGRYDEGAARPADAQRLSRLDLLGPAACRAGVVQHELDL